MSANKVQRATHVGEIRIGLATIPCAVLEDGTRVLTQRGFLQAIGRSGQPTSGKGSSIERMAPFLDLPNLKPYIDNDLERSSMPILFRGPGAPKGATAFGYRAELLPKVCEVYLQARDDDKLTKVQERFASACDLIMRGLAHVGIVALVDEATGYQEIRDREALQNILDRFLRQEFAKWAKRFPDNFYRELFRLRGWQWRGMKVNRPSIVGHYTNDIVYARLAPGVLDELRRVNPKDEQGRRESKHHQWLTDDVGHPALQAHLTGVQAIMRGATSWDGFMRMLQRAYPKINTNLDLPLEDPEEPN